MLDSSGVHVVDAYVAEGEVLMGSARSQREAEMQRQNVLAELMYRRDKIQLEHQLAELTARHNSISHELEWKRQEAELLELAERERLDREASMQNARLKMRRADPNGNRQSPPKARKR
jgi:circadian clock protein KaiC